MVLGLTFTGVMCLLLHRLIATCMFGRENIKAVFISEGEKEKWNIMEY